MPDTPSDTPPDSPPKFPFGALVISLISVLILGLAAVSLIREYGRDYYLEEEKPVEAPSRELAEQFLMAAEEGETEKAVVLARRLLPENYKEFPDSSYLKYVNMSGLNGVVLTAPFNELDALFWKDQLCLRKMALDSEGKPKSIEQLFNMLVKNVKLDLAPGKKSLPSSLMEVIERKSGTVSDKMELLCSLAPNAGYDAKIVVLHNENKKPIHRYCELRKGDEVIIADFAYEKFFPLKDKLPDCWPVKIKKAFANPKIVFQVSPFGAYRPVNQKLASILKNAGVSSFIPEIKDPRTELEIYRKFHGNPNLFLAFYQKPFVVLRLRKGIPPYWRTQDAPLPKRK